MDKTIILNPIITEKATMLSDQRKYMFLVKKGATKPEIRKALEFIYKVKIEDVHVINTSPKPRRMGMKIGSKAGFRKAIVTLKEGQKMDVMPN
jgi:large subunit ribosomal protein L23